MYSDVKPPTRVGRSNVGIAYEPSAQGRRSEKNRDNMKNVSAKRIDDDLRPEYDLSQLKGGVRGKVLSTGNGWNQRHC
jgi:hypothetical protein